MIYKFTFEEKNYELKKENLEELFNDEEVPVKGINIDTILNILNNSDKVEFEKAYYNSYCNTCKTGKEEGEKFFDFIECNFYIFTKNQEFIISNIDKEYENTNFNKLLKEKKVDNSYIVTIGVCKHCGEYSVIIEEIDI